MWHTRHTAAGAFVLTIISTLYSPGSNLWQTATSILKHSISYPTRSRGQFVKGNGNNELFCPAKNSVTYIK